MDVPSAKGHHRAAIAERTGGDGLTVPLQRAFRQRAQQQIAQTAAVDPRDARRCRRRPRPCGSSRRAPQSAWPVHRAASVPRTAQTGRRHAARRAIRERRPWCGDLGDRCRDGQRVAAAARNVPDAGKRELLLLANLGNLRHADRGRAHADVCGARRQRVDAIEIGGLAIGIGRRRLERAVVDADRVDDRATDDRIASFNAG